MPVLRNGVDVATLRAQAIATSPSIRRLRQQRGRRRSDGMLVVRIDGGHYAGQDGHLVPRHEVERREKVQLYDSDLLMIPGDNRSWILADDR